MVTSRAHAPTKLRDAKGHTTRSLARKVGAVEFYLAEVLNGRRGIRGARRALTGRTPDGSPTHRAEQ